MTIGLVAVGQGVKISKINELIRGANDLAFSWVKFNGTTGAIIASGGNIASVTPIDSNRAYRVAFTTPLASSGYCVVGMPTALSGHAEGFLHLESMQRGSFDIRVRSASGAVGLASGAVMVMVVGPNPDAVSSSNAIITVASHVISDSALTPYGFLQVRFSLNADGTAGFLTTGGAPSSGLYSGEWIDIPEDASLHQVKARLIGGQPPEYNPTGGQVLPAPHLLDTWLDLNVNRHWELLMPNVHASESFENVVQKDCVLYFEIREKASRAVRLAFEVRLSITP